MFNYRNIKYVIFYSQLRQYLYSDVPNLMTVEFLLSVKSQFTANIQNTLHVNQDKSDHERSHTFKIPGGGFEGFDRY
jgi:hypothetical protein